MGLIWLTSTRPEIVGKEQGRCTEKKVYKVRKSLVIFCLNISKVIYEKLNYSKVKKNVC